MTEIQASKDSTITVICNCAATPPTMPTYRKRHLPTCPIWPIENAAHAQHELKEPVTVRTSKDSMISDLRAAAQYGGIDLAMAKERLYWKAADEIERLRSRPQVFSNLCDELIQFAECNCKLGAKAGCTCGLKPILERYLAMHPSPFTAETGPKFVEVGDGHPPIEL